MAAGDRADGGTASDAGARSGSWAGNGLVDGLENGFAGGLVDFYLIFLLINRGRRCKLHA